MNLLIAVLGVFVAYPDISRIKVVKGSYSPHNHYNFDDKYLINKWHNDKRDIGALKGMKPIVMHAFNEWKRAKIIQGRFDFPKSEFYWGPHGLVKRSIESTTNNNNSQRPQELAQRDVSKNSTRKPDLSKTSERISGTKYESKKVKERPFEVIPTIFLEPKVPEASYSLPVYPQQQHDCKEYSSLPFHEYLNKFRFLKQNFEGVPQVNSYPTSQPRTLSHHSHGHGHTHFHQSFHTHGSFSNTNLNHGATLLPSNHHGSFASAHLNHGATLLPSNHHGSFASAHLNHGASIFPSGHVNILNGNGGNVPHTSGVIPVAPQTQITNINIPQQHTAGFSLHGGPGVGFNSGLNSGFGSFVNHQQSGINFANPAGLNFGTGASSSNIQIAQVSGVNNAVSQTSLRDVEDDGTEKLRAPFIFQFPLNEPRFDFSRSTGNEPLKKNNDQMSLKTTKRSVLINQQVDGKYLRRKRSVPLVKLAIDPSAKLDIFKTTNNAGEFVAKSLDDKLSPLSHLKDLTGSVRDTIMSSARIFPEDLIIPARYRVIDTHQHDIVQIPLSSRSFENFDQGNNYVGGINPTVFNQPKVTPTKPNEKPPPPKKNSLRKNVLSKNPERVTKFDPGTLYKTYQKVGEVLRNTFTTGQQTLSHFNDAIQSGRQMIHTTKYTAPRLLLPLAKIPALQKPGTSPPVKPDKILLLTPKGSGLENIVSSSLGGDRGFVSTSNLFDSFGVTYPEERTSPRLGSTLDALVEAEETLGATDLRDFVFKVKNELERPHTLGEKNVIGENPLPGSCTCETGGKTIPTKSSDQEELVSGEGLVKGQEELGAAFITNKNLVKPFMGRITNQQIHNMFNFSDNVASQNMIRTKRDIDYYNIDTGGNIRDFRRKRGLYKEPVLGAINPTLYEKYFDEPLNEIKDHHRNPFKQPEGDQGHQQISKDENKIEVNHKKFYLKPLSSKKSLEKLIQKLNLDNQNLVTTNGPKPKIFEMVLLSDQQEKRLFKKT